MTDFAIILQQSPKNTHNVSPIIFFHTKKLPFWADLIRVATNEDPTSHLLDGIQANINPKTPLIRTPHLHLDPYDSAEVATYTAANQTAARAEYQIAHLLKKDNELILAKETKTRHESHYSDH